MLNPPTTIITRSSESSLGSTLPSAGSGFRRNSCTTVLLPASTKEIEFVVPPTVEQLASATPTPTGVRRQSATPLSSRCPSASMLNTDVSFVNKGWNILQHMMVATSAVTRSGEQTPGRSSRSLSVSTLGIHRASSSNNLMPKGNQERRASTNSIFLSPNGIYSPRRGGRSPSKGSVHAVWTPPTQASQPNSAPGSRRSSRPTISIEHAPEIVGNARFGGLNPSLYMEVEKVEEREETFPENHLGRVYFSLHYDSIQGGVSVLVKRIRNLPKNTKEAGITNKTYVKLSLLPDERSQQRCSPSSDSFADLNPVFNETFLFPASLETLANRSVQLVVMNVDVNRKHRTMGETIVDLADVDLTKGRLNLTADLEKYVRRTTGNQSCAPELLLSVAYSATISRLTVNVVEAKHVKMSESGTPPDTYVRVQLMLNAKECKRKKTSLCKKEESPQYKESFNFKLDEAELGHVSVVVTLMQQLPLLEKDRSVGGVTLGGAMFARGSGQKHWEEVLQFPKSHIQRWHTLALTDKSG